MAKYVLDKLLDIREKRQDDLVHQVAAAKAAVIEAQSQLEEKQQNLRDFEQVKPEKQNRLYQAVMNQIVQRKQLDALKIALAELDKQHLVFREDVIRAEQHLEEKKKQQETLQQELIAATKNKMKLDIHKEEWMAEEQKIEEYKAEADMEDLAKGVNQINEDDDSL